MATFAALVILAAAAFALSSLWIPAAGCMLFSAYLIALATRRRLLRKKRESVVTKAYRQQPVGPEGSPVHIETWQLWAFLAFMVVLAGLALVTAHTWFEWVGFAVVMIGVGLGVWMIAVQTRRTRRSLSS